MILVEEVIPLDLVADELRVDAEIARADYEESLHPIPPTVIARAIREMEAEATEYLQVVQVAPRLSSMRNPQRDFFVADILDWAPKDDVASMEHPLFALKAGDRRVRTYTRNGVTVRVEPGARGCATIHDKDLWIYCVSQLVEAMNRGREDVSRTVVFTAYDFLVTTGRRTDGDGYTRLGDALARLSGTRIITNLKTPRHRERRGFGLIDSFRIIERDTDNRMISIQIDLPKWLWASVEARQVLTLSQDYFRIRKPLERRLYELARKHCGHQSRWRAGLVVLREKSGSTASIREFRRAIRDLSAVNNLPDYWVAFDEVADNVTFYARGPKGMRARLADALPKEQRPRSSPRRALVTRVAIQGARTRAHRVSDSPVSPPVDGGRREANPPSTGERG